jgi:uncharacterized protein (TIGR00288 family)
MSTETLRADVAVFIDFENVYVSVREKLDATPNFESIMDRCNDLGRVVIARAYADWYRYPRITSALYANGIEPMYVPTYYYDKEMGRTGRAIKNSVDMNLCIDVMKTLFLNDNIGKFVLATGDRDFIPLVNSIRQQGKEVIIIGIGGAASTHLAQSADEFIFYEQLVGKASVPPIRKAKGSKVETTPGNAAHTKADTVIEPDIYDTLVEAIHVVRERGYLSTLGSLKLVMKELMGGDFKESRYKDSNGRNFAKFKDFVIDAEKRGKVQIYTNGTVSEVFLPGEDASKLSQFSDFKEETPTESQEPSSTNGSHAQPSTPSSSSSSSSSRPRRRRRPKNQRQDTSQSSSKEKQRAEKEKEEQKKADDEMHEHINGLSMKEQKRALEMEEEDTPDKEEYLERANTASEESKEPDEHSYSPTSEVATQTRDEMLADGDFPELEDENALLFNVGEAITLSQMIDFLYSDEDLMTPAEGRSEEVPAHEPVVPEPETTADIGSSEETRTLAADDEPSTPSVAPEAVGDAPPEASLSKMSTDEVTDSSSPTTETAEKPSAEEQEAIHFTDEEWQAFCRMMNEFSRPVSFAHIFDSLRNLRKEQVITRTNEQLRHLVKQAINKGILERSGRGKRVYYSLKEKENENEEAQTKQQNGHETQEEAE